MEQQTNQIIHQVINFWADRNKAITLFFNKYDEAVYYEEVAPGRSRAVYLLGHLIAISDALLPMFDLGERLYPELDGIFVTAADKSVPVIPPLADLKKYWEKINETLAEHFTKMTDATWMDRHMSISAEDFKKEPMRNKLNVLINRTNHQSYHLGQLVLLPT